MAVCVWETRRCIPLAWSLSVSVSTNGMTNQQSYKVHFLRGHGVQLQTPTAGSDSWARQNVSEKAGPYKNLIKAA